MRAPLVPLWLLGAATLLAAQSAPPGGTGYPERFTEPMALYSSGLGPYTRTITTRNPEAQAYFTQGMQLLFSFTPEDAARSFREAHRRDSTCAMCYWGEALAWGPYLNGGMQRDAAPRAHAAIARAQQLGTHAGPVERDLIEALATRYSATHDPKTRVRLDSAYARAMARAYEAHPADLDVATWYAESLMLLEPRRGTWSLEKPSVREILRVLEGVLARDVTHPGACHLLIHATESTTVPGKAEACADHLGHSIPGASHINHMPSHTYNRLGRWGDAVRANLEAWHSDQRAAVGEGFAIYPSHNLHMLLFAASMDGQGAVAIQAARDYARLVKGGVGYVALALARFGRFTEVLELEQTPDDPTYRGFWDFARGYAHLRAGDPDNGRVYLERLDRAASTLPDTTRFRWHATRDLLSVLGGILRAELLRQGGKPDAAIAALERAVEVEDGLTYDEPEPLVFSARHFLGAALLDARRPGEAERVYRASLADHPNNGWSLLGLEQSLRAQGRQAEAAEIRTAFTRAWARSDTWVRQSRF